MESYPLVLQMDADGGFYTNPSTFLGSVTGYDFGGEVPSQEVKTDPQGYEFQETHTMWGPRDS